MEMPRDLREEECWGLLLIKELVLSADIIASLAHKFSLRIKI